MTSVRRQHGTSRVKAGESFSSIQQELFQRLDEPQRVPADLDIHFELLGAISYALREARSRGISRERVVDVMNALLPDLERPITLRQLNAWTATSKEYSEFPARYLPAFCQATDCDVPMRRMVQPLGRDLVDRRELVAKALGENLVQTAALRRQARQLKQTLGG